MITESPIDVEVPLNPVYTDEVTPTSLGPTGVDISGVALFNDYEDMQRSIVALDDNSPIDGAYDGQLEQRRVVSFPAVELR